MTWICHRGIELSARDPAGAAQLRGADARDLRGRRARRSLRRQPAARLDQAAARSWFNPFAMNFRDLVVALLLGVFIYWGWDSGVAGQRGVRGLQRGPGQARRWSRRSCSCVIYLLVSAGAQAFHGVGFLANEEQRGKTCSTRSARACSARSACKFLIVAVLTSAVGLDADDDPADRAHDAVDGPLGRDPVGARHESTSASSRPTVSTLGFGAALDRRRGAADPDLRNGARTRGRRARDPGLLLLRLHRLSPAPWYYRRELFKSARKFSSSASLPLLGGLMMYGDRRSTRSTTTAQGKRRRQNLPRPHAAAVVRRDRRWSSASC